MTRFALRMLGATWLLLSSCGPSAPAAPPPAPAPAPPPETAAPPVASSSAPAPEASAAAPLPPIRFEPGKAADAPSPMPAVAIKTPRPGELVAADKASDFGVKLDVKNWDTAPGGKHVHLILDNNPYKPIYDTKAPVRLSELVQGPIGEGEHVLVAFPSRSDHESVKPDKGKAPLAIVAFFVGKKGKPTFDPKAPMMIYSRPKGTYNGPSLTARVLVDFYLHNVKLGQEQTIQLAVSGPGAEALQPLVIKEWKPYLLENLRNGDYGITMQLLDQQGRPVPGDWNKAHRTITINRDAPDDPKAGTAPAAAAHP